MVEGEEMKVCEGKSEERRSRGNSLEIFLTKKCDGVVLRGAGSCQRQVVSVCSSDRKERLLVVSVFGSKPSSKPRRKERLGKRVRCLYRGKKEAETGKDHDGDGDI